MLRELFIHNLAIIEDLTVKLDAGLNIITGETGAGKSVVIGALGLLLGLRASSDILRSGCEKGSVSGAFDVDSAFQQKVSEFSIPDLEDGLIVLSREISREGKNLCRINEKLFSLSGFRALGSLLLDIYGQNEERGLLVPGTQLELLDQLGGHTLVKCKGVTGACYKRLMDLERRIADKVKQQQEISEKTDFLQFQLKELEAASLKDINEEQRLEEEIRILASAEFLAENSLQLYQLLFGNEGDASSVYDKLSRSLEVMENMLGADPSLQERITLLKDILYSVEDLSEFFRSYGERIEHNPNRLEILQDRLDLLRRLGKKYKRSLEELIAFRDELAGILENQSFSQQSIGELEKERARLSGQYLEAAASLTALRKETGSFLSGQVTAILRELEMKEARFEVAFSPREGYSANGMEDIQFLFSANTGEPLKPLQKVASGGELSRLMLALKSVLAKVDSVPVLVFDEADTGIGGEAARKVGLRIAKLAETHQVICVTHSAQVAVFADNHFFIAKEISQGRTVAQVQQLNGSEKKVEIARMLGGRELDTANRHAEKMLEEANKAKN